MVLAGYDTAAGNNTQNNSTVGLVNVLGTINTSTTTSLLSGNNTRGAATVDGTAVWVTGPNGVVYEPTGTALGGTLVDATPNGHAIEVSPAAVSPTGSTDYSPRRTKGVSASKAFRQLFPPPRARRIPFSAG